MNRLVVLTLLTITAFSIVIFGVLSEHDSDGE